jgi:hypothetical protein
MRASPLLVAGLAAAILSVAPAKAEKNESFTRCNGTTWPVIMPVPCGPQAMRPATYLECTAMSARMAWRPPDAWWYCSSQGYKR